MTGKDHIIAGTCSCIILDSGFLMLSQSINQNNTVIAHICDNIRSIFAPTLNSTPDRVVWYVGAVVLFLFGSLLPDIDSKKSLLGRMIHLPFEHHTWTHTVWFVLLTAGLIWLNPVFMWMTVGIVLHLFWDSLGAQGVAWFYPISKYRRYGNAKVKYGHKLKIYHTGQSSEYILIGIILTITFLIVCLDIYFGLFRFSSFKSIFANIHI